MRRVVLEMEEDLWDLMLNLSGVISYDEKMDRLEDPEPCDGSWDAWQLRQNERYEELKAVLRKVDRGGQKASIKASPSEIWLALADAAKV